MMNSIRNTERFVGILFLAAMAASLIGGGMLESFLDSQDLHAAINSNAVIYITGIVLEVTNALAVAGIGILLFPVLKLHSHQLAISYISFRMLEMVCCLSAAVIPILIFGSNQNEISLEIVEFLLQSRQDIARIFIPLFFSLGAIVLYSFLYVTKLLPRYISVWGFIGVLGIVALNILNIQDSIGMVLALPIILNEIFLGIWLIAKGFNREKLNSLIQKTNFE